MLNFYILVMWFLCCVGIGINIRNGDLIGAIGGLLLTPVFMHALGHL